MDTQMVEWAEKWHSKPGLDTHSMNSAIEYMLKGMSDDVQTYVQIAVANEGELDELTAIFMGNIVRTLTALSLLTRGRL